MDEVVQALEGSIAPMECFVHDHTERVLCSHEPDAGRGCATKLLWTRVQGGIIRSLQTTTLAELVEFSRRTRAACHDPVRAGASTSRHERKLEMADLEIRNLHVRAGDKEILRGLDLTVDKGEIHALMGPNGSGKSTLANAIMGHPNLEVTEGEIICKGEDITEADARRARPAWACSWPSSTRSSVPGVTVTKYLRTVLNAHREAHGEEPIPLKEFRQTVEAAMKLTNVPKEFSTPVPERGLLRRREEADGDPAARAPAARAGDPRRDRLRASTSTRCASSPNGVNAVAGPDMGVLIITHYQRILHLVQPSHVHVIYQGRIVKEGGPELVDELEAKGYGWITDEAATQAAV